MHPAPFFELDPGLGAKLGREIAEKRKLNLYVLLLGLIATKVIARFCSKGGRLGLDHALRSGVL